jgi:sulfite oxidase
MKSKKVITTIQCGGNRRGEFDKTSGTQWGIGAISTAEWEGIPLCNLLENYNAKYIHFEGYDGVKSSIPFKKGRNCFGDVLVAYKMNGVELPRDHGYPVRIIVPGYVGIKNIKWLKKITLSNEEVDGPWQRGMAYKILPGSIRCLEDVSKIDLDKIDTIEELPIQSCITHIEEIRENINNKNFRIHGYTYSSKPMIFPRVDVSIDGGKTWKIAGVNPHFEDLLKFKWGWALWSVDVKIDDTPCDIICMASDKGTVQPSDIKDIWNIRGLANNSVHKKLLEKV